MKYENRVVRVQNLFFHTLPERIERWQEEGYRIINTNQSKTFSGEEEIVIFLEREVEEKKQKTNYDRIKSMSVEEMAEFFEGHFDCNFCPESERLADNPLLKYEKCDEKCTYHITQWLLQEVIPNDGNDM